MVSPLYFAILKIQLNTPFCNLWHILVVSGILFQNTEYANLLEAKVLIPYHFYIKMNLLFIKNI